jgi:hypothetical protein
MKSASDVHAYGNHERARFLTNFYALVIGTILVYVPVRLMVDPAFQRSAPFVVGILVVYGLGLFLARRGSVAVSGAIIVFALSVGMLALAWLSPENSHILYLLPIPVLIAAATVSLRGSILIALAEGAGIVLLTLLSEAMEFSFAVRPLGVLTFISSLAVAIARHIRATEAHQQHMLAETRNATVFALAYQAELRDNTTGEHLERTARYVRTLSEQAAADNQYAGYLTPSYIDDMVLASMLHDVGKVGIPDAILLKPGGLNAEEFEIIQTHCELGVRVLEAARKRISFSSFYDLAVSIAQSHHEKWDGSGYPHGLQATAIPLSARIMAICDVYDALRSSRPYKKPMSHEEAVAVILEGSGSHFDPQLVEVFRLCEPVFDSISWEITYMPFVQ